MTGALLIRPARPEDADNIHAALLGIAQATGEADKVSSTPDDIRRFGFGEHPAFSVLIAEIDSGFVGMCLYFPIFSSWMGRPGVYVQDLFTVEGFRGRKVGERLLRRVARLSKDAGGAYLRLSVDAGNEAAQGFYRRLGLEWAQEERVYKIAGEAFHRFAGTDPVPSQEPT